MATSRPPYLPHEWFTHIHSLQENNISIHGELSITAGYPFISAAAAIVTFTITIELSASSPDEFPMARNS
jgi:hypothetical protein